MQEQDYKLVDPYVICQKEILGKGAYGLVYKAFHKDDKTKLFAAKVIPLKKLENEMVMKQIKREIAIMKSISNPNLVNFIDAVQSSKNLYLILELCSQGNLRSYLKSKGKLPENEVISILKSICNGFKCLYEKKIIHRDIKPENILIENGKIKIADFGFARVILDSGMEDLQNFTKVGSPLYTPPQILECQDFSAKCDIWSVGIMIYELLFNLTPWIGSGQIDMAKNIRSIPLKFPSQPTISPELKDLLSKMLILEDKDRISWPDVFQHAALQI